MRRQTEAWPPPHSRPLPPAIDLIYRNDPLLFGVQNAKGFHLATGVSVTTQDSARDRPHSVVERLNHMFRDWLKHRRELKEMRELNTSEFDRIANDLRISPADLNELVRLGPHAVDELPGLLTALGIDGSDLARVEPLVLHDMERICALCEHKRECNRDLAAGTSAEHYQGYCLNASVIGQLGHKATNKDLKGPAPPCHL